MLMFLISTIRLPSRSTLSLTTLFRSRFKFLLEHGQTGLSTAFDFPTLMGYDSDHPRSEGEVGKTGVAISCLADMEVLFEDRKSTRLNSSHVEISYAVFCLKKKIIVSTSFSCISSSSPMTLRCDSYISHIPHSPFRPLNSAFTSPHCHFLINLHHLRFTVLF